MKRGQSRNENRNTGVGKVYELSFGVGEFSKHTLERGRQRGAIYLSCQQFSGKWGGAALDLMRRGSNSETTRTTTTTTTTTSTIGGSEDARRIPVSWWLYEVSGVVRGVDSLFGGGRLMKYPCQFNRVTSPVSRHPKSCDDPLRERCFSLVVEERARGNILSANKPFPPSDRSSPFFSLFVPLHRFSS